MNKWAEVAALFGKQLGEQFRVKSCFGEYTAYFTEDGYMIKATRDLWKADASLADLISGEAVIIDG